MDFFAAQKRARRRTIMLVIPAVLSLLAIIILAYFLLAGSWWLFQHNHKGRETVAFVEWATGARLSGAGWWHPRLFWMTAGSITLLIAGGSIVRIMELRREGGNFIAHQLRAKVVRFDTTDFEERRLINIVEELSIASGVRIPELFILEEDGINSFCAGHDVDSAVLIITRGAAEVLTRDELQAVLAHEFSHILNADMVINTRMVGVLHGLMMLTVAGRNLMVAGGGFVIAGAGFLALGCVGNMLGSIIQAMTCRQREWLADAHAIQFTRNPGAVVSALKKIGGYHCGSCVPRPFAIESAHMFFANAIDKWRILRTHPSLAKRIRAIAPGFDGEFPRVPPSRSTVLRAQRMREGWALNAGSRESPSQTVPYAKPFSAAELAGDTLMRDKHGVSWGANVRWPGPLAPETVVAQISAGPGNPLFAAAIIDEIDAALREAAHDPARARLVLLGLLCDDDANPSAQARQRGIISRALSPEEIAGLDEMRSLVASLPVPLRLPLADLALPALKALSSPQIDALIKTSTDLIAADGKVSLCEYALRQIVVRQLRPAAAARVETNVMNMAGSISILLSAMAYAGADVSRNALAAFNEGKRHFALSALRDRLQLHAEGALLPGSLTMALSNAERAAPLIKKDILAALAQVAAHDGVVMPSEQKLVRAVAAALNCPAPILGDITSSPQPVQDGR